VIVIVIAVPAAFDSRFVIELDFAQLRGQPRSLFSISISISISIARDPC